MAATFNILFIEWSCEVGQYENKQQKMTCRVQNDSKVPDAQLSVLGVVIQFLPVAKKNVIHIFFLFIKPAISNC